MSYRTLLTVVTNAADARAAIGAAARLCASEDAHLDVLALGVDHSNIGYSYVGASAAMMPMMLDRSEEDARRQEAAALAALAEQFPDLRCSVETVMVQIGMLTDLIASRARYTDLVVLSQPYGDGRGVESEAVLEAALFEGHAPVLVLPAKPPSPDAPTLPRRIVLAWDQSAEAMAATRRALPLLKGAERVSIVMIDPSSQGSERSDPGAALCQMLVRHGVRAEVTVLARTRPQVADVLMQHIRDEGADLLVMGAYGHSRFREAILGGATRAMLTAAEVPMFMAH